MNAIGGHKREITGWFRRNLGAPAAPISAWKIEVGFLIVGFKFLESSDELERGCPCISHIASPPMGSEVGRENATEHNQGMGYSDWIGHMCSRH